LPASQSGQGSVEMLGLAKTPVSVKDCRSARKTDMVLKDYPAHD